MRISKISLFAINTRTALGMLLLSLLAMAGAAFAQLPVPPSSQFDITGFIQAATLGGAGSGPGVGAHQGGFITVNGHLITVPSETIVILPASALTWAELFTNAPAPYGPTQTGLALNDVPAPLSTYEARIVGNRVLGGAGGADVYIAGLIYISQQALNTGQGFINCINYTTGELLVGGVIGNCATGARVQLNDPLNPAVGTGRYGRAVTPDLRFTVDQDNPTIRSVTGFPMCIPRVDPASPVPDALCSQSQRLVLAAGPPIVYSTNYTMNDPTLLPGVPPDATQQAPFEVGDYVTFAGTLVHDGASPTAGPWPGVASTYISAHTVINNTAIYTVKGTNPAYVAIDVTLIGTGGLTIIGANEAAIRTRFEGFTTDVDTSGVAQRPIHLFGIDLNPLTGAGSDRDWGSIGVDPGPPLGAAKGRWRYRPPCTVTVPTQRDCTPPPANSYLPPTREVRAVVQGAWTPGGAQTLYANGILAGQYHAPISDYLFPEMIPGNPVPENNFNTIPFLSSGGYTSAPTPANPAGTLVSVLNPWPSNVPPPPPQCTIAPVANTGGPYTTSSGGSITLNGSATTADTPVTFLWTADIGTLSNPNIANPVYTAPGVGVLTTANLTLTVSTCAGSNTAPTTVAINGASAPTVNHVTPLSVFSGAAGAMSVTGSDPNLPALLPLTFAAVQAPAGTLLNFLVTQGANPPGTDATITFNAPVLPATQLIPTIVNLTVTATNTANVSSAPEFTSVTVNPTPDVITPVSAEYRISQKRLIVTVNDANPNVTLKLQPYVTTAGTTYNPDPAAGGVGNVFTLAGGVGTLTINGVPEPACGNPNNTTPCPATPLDVKSNIQNVPGDSGFFALTRIR